MVIGHFLQKVMALPKDQQFQWGRAVPASNLWALVVLTRYSGDSDPLALMVLPQAFQWL